MFLFKCTGPEAMRPNKRAYEARKPQLLLPHCCTESVSGLVLMKNSFLKCLASHFSNNNCNLLHPLLWKCQLIHLTFTKLHICFNTKGTCSIYCSNYSCPEFTDAHFGAQMHIWIHRIKGNSILPVFFFLFTFLVL